MKERQILQKAQRDPVWFVEEVLNAHPWEKQAEILRAVRDYPRTAVRSCHGVGKSFIAGRVILWFLSCFPYSIVLSTAPTWRQVEKLIWKEVRASYRRAKIPLGGNLLPKSPEIQIVQDEWYAAGLSTNEPDRFQGFHEENILVVVDEAAGVPEEIFEAIEGVLTSSNARLLLLGNPTSTAGTFFQAFRGGGWKTLSISAFDTPNFMAFGITESDIAADTWRNKITGPLPNPKLITPEWVADKYRRWGPESPAYIARVKGEFPPESEDTLIPLAWIEAAMERWHDMEHGEPVELGVDVARFGSDKTVIGVRHGWKVIALHDYSQQDTMETAGRVIQAYKEHRATDIKIDVIGLGAGVADRLREQSAPVTEVNVAEKPNDPENFDNLRSELWWNLRQLLDPNTKMNPNPIGLPPNDELLADLSGIKYKINSSGKIVVESKAEMKKRLGRSPDYGDTVCLLFAKGRRMNIDALRALASIKIYR